jgi:hypothetical protein
MNKGIIFLGDSYTWGQGLNFYGKFEETHFPTKEDGEFYLNKLSEREIEFIKEHRFSNIVSKHLNKKTIQRELNGGGHYDMIEFLNSIHIHGYDTLVVQFTDVYRDLIYYDYKGNTNYCALSIHQDYVPSEYETFINYLSDNFDSSLEKFKEYHIKKVLNKFKDLFLYYEGKHRFKCFMFTWQHDVVEYIKKDEFLNKRFIQLEYNGVKYDSMFEMATLKNPELTITHDPVLKEMGISAHDGHITFKAHQIIAESIIKKIKNYE